MNKLFTLYYEKLPLPPSDSIRLDGDNGLLCTNPPHRFNVYTYNNGMVHRRRLSTTIVLHRAPCVGSHTIDHTTNLTLFVVILQMK